MCIYLINIFDSNGSWLLLWGLSLVLDSRGYSSLWCLGLSLQWLLLWSAGSEHMSFSSCSTQTQGWGSWAPEHRLSICGTWAQFWGMGDLPEPGIKPVSPALVDRFLTTGPPGRSHSSAYFAFDLFLFTPRVKAKLTFKYLVFSNL